jgi:hypothetical protein
LATTYTDEEILKLVEDSTLMIERIIDMLPVDMSYGRILPLYAIVFKLL